MESHEVKEELKLWEALIPIIVTFAAILCMEMPLLKGYKSIYVAFALGMASTVAIGVLRLGVSLKEILKSVISVIIELRRMLLAIVIISLLMGAWTISGIIPAFIYYGVQTISPAFCLVAICLICVVMSFITGSSQVTAAGVGVVLIAIAKGIGIPSSMAAGAVISGTSFGDKMSPLSFTTNLAAEAAGTDIKTHIKHMLYTTGVSLLIALLFFAVLGASYTGEDLDSTRINMMIYDIREDFYITPVLMIVPLVTVVAMMRKKYFIPSLIISTILGIAIAIFVQKKEIMDVIMTMLGMGNTRILGGHYNWVGLFNMAQYTARVGIAVIFGGLLEKLGILEALAKKIVCRVKSIGALVTATMLTSIASNMALGGKYLAIWTTGRMYKNEYERRSLATCNLSRCLEDAGTLIAPLIPWSITGVVIAECIGVPTIQYLPFCFLNIINPIISIIYGYTGVTIKETFDDRSLFESK